MCRCQPEAPTVRDLPDALCDGERFAARLAGHRTAVFLDYHGVLPPIVDRPEDAVMSRRHAGSGPGLDAALHGVRPQRSQLTRRRQMMSIDNLTVAGSQTAPSEPPLDRVSSHPTVSRVRTASLVESIMESTTGHGGRHRR